MSLHRSPEEHDANPPESWTVKPYGGRRYALVSDGHVLGTFERKSEAERHRTEGFYFDLWQKEDRWFRGEPVAGWKPYAPLVGVS